MHHFASPVLRLMCSSDIAELSLFVVCIVYMHTGQVLSSNKMHHFASPVLRLIRSSDIAELSLCARLSDADVVM